MGEFEARKLEELRNELSGKSEKISDKKYDELMKQKDNAEIQRETIEETEHFNEGKTERNFDEELTEKIDELVNEIDALREENFELKKENSELKDKIEELQDEIEALYFERNTKD